MKHYFVRETDISLPELKNFLAQIKQLEPFKNIHQTYQNTTLLERAQELVELYLVLLQELSNCQIELIHPGRIKEILDILAFAAPHFAEFGRLDYPQNDANDKVLEGCLSRIEGNGPNWVNPLIMTILECSRGESLRKALALIDERLLQANDTVEQLANADKAYKESLLKANIEKEQILSQANHMLTRMKDISEEIGIKHQAIRFAREANRQEKEANVWLAVLGGLSFILLLYTFFDLEPNISKIIADSEPAFLIPGLVTRAVIFSVASIVIFIALRNFSACRHNATVNKHRQNALSTFELFADSAASETSTKNQILLEATRAIFSPQPTGYLKAANETQPQAKVDINSLINHEP